MVRITDTGENDLIEYAKANGPVVPKTSGYGAPTSSVVPDKAGPRYDVPNYTPSPGGLPTPQTPMQQVTSFASGLNPGGWFQDPTPYDLGLESRGYQSPLATPWLDEGLQTTQYVDPWVPREPEPGFWGGLAQSAPVQFGQELWDIQQKRNAMNPTVSPYTSGGDGGYRVEPTDAMLHGLNTASSGNYIAENVTGYDLNNLPYNLGYVTDAINPLGIAAVAGGPSVPIIGSTLGGSLPRRALGEIGIDIASRVGAEQAAGERGEAIPYFGDLPPVARGLIGGLAGGIGAAGGVKAIDNVDFAAAGRSVAEANPFAAPSPSAYDLPVGAIDPSTGRAFEWQSPMGGADDTGGPWFHGSRSQIEQFQLGHQSDDLGVFFSADPEYSRKYMSVDYKGEEGTPTLYQANLQPANTFDFRPGQTDPNQLQDVFAGLRSKVQAVLAKEDGNELAAMGVLERLDSLESRMLVTRDWDSRTVADFWDIAQRVTRLETGKPFSTAALRDVLRERGYDSVRSIEGGADTMIAIDPSIIRTHSAVPETPFAPMGKTADEAISPSPSALSADAPPVMSPLAPGQSPLDTASLFESRAGITGRGVPEGRGAIGPIRQTNLFGEVADQPVFRGEETPAILAARKEALDTLAEGREIRRSGITAAEVRAGRQSQAGGILAGYNDALAQGKSGSELLDAAVDNIPGGRIIQTTAAPITPTTRDALKNVVAEWFQESPNTRAFEARTARDVIEAMSSPRGYMPQPHEDALLRRILGDELTDTVSSRQPGFNVEGAKVEAPTRPLPLGEQTAPVQPPIEALDEGRFLTDEQRGANFFAALDAKRAEAQAFTDRLRNTERDAPQMTLAQQAEQLSLDRAEVPKGIYPSGTKIPQPRTVKPGDILRFARLAMGEILALPRAIKSSLDLSAPLRQGAMLGWRHPKAIPGAFAAQIRAFGSANGARKMDALLDARPNARIHKAAKLYRAPWENADLTLREEAFLSRLAEKVPGVAASNRAYATYLNKLRADSFDAVWNSMDELQRTSDAAEALARFINVASGRGELPGVLEGAGPFLGQVLYSPRYVTSRPHAVWMAFSGNGDALVRKEAQKTLAAYFTGTSTILALGAAAGLWEVELDPRSADFGKGRIGPLRYDFWTGYAQWMRLFAQVATGETKSTRTGDVYELENRMQPLARFTRSKLNPTVGAAVTELTGTDYKGDRPGNWFDRLTELIAPIQPQELKDAYEAYGWEMAAATLPGFLGAGTSVYEPTAEDTLDELARRHEYKDAYGNTISGQNFRELPAGERDKILKANPELATARIAESGEATQAAAARTAELTEAQKESDKRLKSGELTPEQWKNDYNDRRNELRIRKDEIYAALDLKPGDDPVIDGYYAAIEDAERADKTVDWDKVDAYFEGLSKPTQNYIRAQTGLIRLDTPEVRKFEQARDRIEDAGWFERTDESWANVQAFYPELKKYDSYYDWQDERRNELVKAWTKEYGFSPEFARSEADKAIAEMQPATDYDFYAKQWREAWVEANPQAAYDAWKYGYYTPTNDYAEWLNAMYQAGRVK